MPQLRELSVQNVEELEDLRDARCAAEGLEKIKQDPSRLRPLENYISELIARGELDPDFPTR